MPLMPDTLPGIDEEAPAWAAGMRVERVSLDGHASTLAVWYPASPSSTTAAYEYGGEPPAFRLAGVARDAPPVAVPRRRPLLLLAGAGGSGAFDLGWLGARLAQRGNVVAATETAAALPEICRRLAALADFMTRDTALAALFDAARCAIAGFDLGAVAALAMAGARCAQPADALRDARVCALALLNPYPLTLLARARRIAVRVPVQVIVSAGDRVAPPSRHGAHLAASIAAARLTRLASPADHYVFLGEATAEGRRRVPDMTVDAAVVHRGSVHESTAHLVHDIVSVALSRRRHDSGSSV